MNPNEEQFEKFVKVLREMFMIDDAADLDFGIYKVMHQKQEDIEKYMKEDLQKNVQDEIAQNVGGRRRFVEEELQKAKQGALSLGVPMSDIMNVPRVKALVEELEGLTPTDELENMTYDHLARFFSRYYDDGDFISKRRYSSVHDDSKYAIPYGGEEVMMYWANQDQYYIKSSEYLKNYSFNLDGDKKVVFRVVNATHDEVNSVKEDKNAVRCFALAENEGEDYVSVDGDMLTIRFTYELMKKERDLQKKLTDEALAKLTERINKDLTAFSSLLAHAVVGVEDSPSCLEKHLKSFVARNTCDFFIHKNLRGFLKKELDFYIKNELLHIDDIDSDENRIRSYVALVKTVKHVGYNIIEFLAGIENFQRKLWLKKKFVTESNYCITLDRVPRELYPEIIANGAQRQEWVRLFAIDDLKSKDMFTESYSEPLTEKFLDQNHYLLLDTRFFDNSFKHRLISSIKNLDEQTNGLLIHSDNFQALNFIRNKFQGKAKCIYADPPYNTSASEILYKNSYRDASWLSLLNDRVLLGKEILSDDGIQCTTIDDVEESKLKMLLTSIYGEQPYSVSIRIKPSGRPIPKGFAISHEYALFNKKSSDTSIARLEHSDEQMQRYNEEDEKGKFMWELLRKAGSNSFRENRPTMYFPIYLNPETGKMRVPEMEYDEEKEVYDILEETKTGEIAVYPIKDDGKTEGCWYFGLDRTIKEVEEFKAERQANGQYFIYRRRRKNEGVQPTTFWEDSKYSATEHGTDLLKKLFGKQESFSYPKSIYAVEECLKVMGIGENDLVLDYFGGSATTGHAVINFNRNGGDRKYILIEQENYFDTITKPRIEKVAYSKEWSKGKPRSRETGVSHCFKYITLEQYEDTLNNLVVKSNNGGLFGTYSESYLGYMLDFETRDSLFSIEKFDRPFDYKMQITRRNETSEQTVDLVETFNYLIGLYVEHEEWPDENLCIVKGTTRDGERTLIIWRNVAEVDSEKLNVLFTSMEDKSFDRIYVNGDNNLDNLRTDADIWKVSLTEETFKHKMFEEE